METLEMESKRECQQEVGQVAGTSGAGARVTENSVELNSIMISDDPLRDDVPLLAIFPKEIWEMVLKNVDDPEDLENVSNSSPFFRTFLLPLRTQFLFQKVWPILATSMKQDKYVLMSGPVNGDVWQFHRYSGKLQRVETGHHPLRFPGPVEEEEMQDLEDTMERLSQSPSTSQNHLHYVIAYLHLVIPQKLNFWYSDILALRLVCQSWCQGIDHFYQNHPRHFQITEDPRRNVTRTTCWTDLEQANLYEPEMFRSMNAKQFSSFLGHFGNTHGLNESVKIRSPLISRKVIVHCRFGNEVGTRQQWHDLRSFLMRFGEHIWYMECRLSSDPNVEYNDCLERLSQLLTSLKNLKVLKVFWHGVRFPVADPRAPQQRLPTLENLQFLSISSLASGLFTNLLQSNGHLRMLEIQRFGYHDKLEDIWTIPFPNLKELSIPVDSQECFNLLVQLQQPVPCRLEKVHLDFSEIDYVYEMKWPDVFELLENKWADTLTDVQLKMPKPGREGDNGKTFLEKCNFLRLNLPRVKKFRVMLTTFSSLDFILPMRDTLEYLDVDICFQQRCSKLACQVEKQQVIHFLGYTSRPLESNIWNIFPKLKQYRIFEDCFLEPAWSHTRQDWELKVNEEEIE